MSQAFSSQQTEKFKRLLTFMPPRNRLPCPELLTCKFINTASGYPGNLGTMTQRQGIGLAMTLRPHPLGQ